ncbi:GIY-YIG nuclease family protein [Parapedobacter deserti]|uniref:GIY-YIG nuclease family protein n=1 Tax=Parapedobacter deserti TaxID=1912957 RepID=A0ABV7JH88_9SPHI
MLTYVYILTDSNRSNLHVGMTDNLQKVAGTFQKMTGLLPEGDLRIFRLVYHESFSSEEFALRRFREMSTYTRMQKERLIRKSNPNWLDVRPSQFRSADFLHPVSYTPHVSRH